MQHVRFETFLFLVVVVFVLRFFAFCAHSASGLALLQIASVNAAYSEILTTSCGTPAIATGSTIYELSGLDGLESRETTLLSMAAADCATVQFTQSSTADCFV